MRTRTFLVLAVLTIGLAGTAVTAQDELAARYQQAKDLTMRGDWAQALQLFRDLSAGGSPEASGAAFYVGVCLENLNSRNPEAFAAFEDMRRRFPAAPMAQEALLRQITIAGVIGFSDARFRDFLAGHLGHDDAGVSAQAALSLARLGDERAVDGLVEIMRSGSPSQQMMALDMAPNFQDSTADQMLGRMRRETSDLALKEEVDALRKSIEADREQRQRMESTLKKDVRALIEEIRRKGPAWTEADLITHALFHVMPRAEFVAYVQASTTEQLRIYQEYWEGHEDPDPGTPENEMEREFLRRIDQARNLFSEPWQAIRSQYDAKEWLTPDNTYSPWDARGELLIKYGEPSDIFVVGNNVEEWYYSHLRVDFTVHKYKLNYLRNAIYPGRVSQQDYPDGFVQARYISVPRIEFWPGRRE